MKNNATLQKHAAALRRIEVKQKIFLWSRRGCGKAEVKHRMLDKRPDRWRRAVKLIVAVRKQESFDGAITRGKYRRTSAETGVIIGLFKRRSVTRSLRPNSGRQPWNICGIAVGDGSKYHLLTRQYPAGVFVYNMRILLRVNGNARSDLYRQCGVVAVAWTAALIVTQIGE